MREWQRVFCAKDCDARRRKKAIPLTYFIAKVDDYYLAIGRSLSYYICFAIFCLHLSLRGHKAKCLFNVIEIDYPIKGSKSWQQSSNSRLFFSITLSSPIALPQSLWQTLKSLLHRHDVAHFLSSTSTSIAYTHTHTHNQRVYLTAKNVYIH